MRARLTGATVRPMSRCVWLTTVTFSLAMVAAGSAQAADKLRYTKESTPLFDKKKGRILGSVLPGTPVTVKKRKGRRAFVEINGWSEAYHDLEVLAGQDVRIPRANLVRLLPGVRKVHEEKVDKWETKWFRVTISGWIKSRSLVPDIKQVWSDAQELHLNRCTECHEWRPPEMLTRTQWRGTLVIMSHRAALTPEETALLSQYLQNHAKDAKVEE